MKIIILMSTYNGERYLHEQIDSILAQSVTNQAQLQIIVRDDGSKDGTIDILNAYQAENKLTWYSGKNLRPAKSFWHLLVNAPDADFYAFCDQDDYWFPDKLARAVRRILEQNDQSKPILYCSAYTATDSKLNPIEVEKRALHQYVDYAHALLYSTAPGCTFVFNYAARRAMLLYDMEVQYELIHDWLAHKIVTILGGAMIYDQNPSMYYRQHDANVIGVHVSGMGAFFARVRRFLVGSGRRTRSDSAVALLEVYGDCVTPEVREALDLVANYRNSFSKRMKFMKDKRFLSGTIYDWYLRISIFLGVI